MHYIIPLGSDCKVARYLQKANIRLLSMPLDWVVVPIQSSIALFETNFSDFLDEQNLKFLPTQFRKLFAGDDDHIIETRTIITPVACMKYNILFPHDFSERGKEEFVEVKQKYQRRIDRMFDLLSDPNNTFSFIAEDSEPHDFQLEQYEAAGLKFVNEYKGWKTRFDSVIKKKFPSLKYNLYILDEYRRKK